MPESLFTMRIDDEDRALLEACAAKDKLSMSDTVRRAIRAYARALGVEPAAKRGRAKPKRK